VLAHVTYLHIPRLAFCRVGPGWRRLLDDVVGDRERLAAAGYVSKYIPLFALPGPDGAASGRQIEGGIKGDGAVGYISARLKEMLAD